MAKIRRNWILEQTTVYEVGRHLITRSRIISSSHDVSERCREINRDATIDMVSVSTFLLFVG